MRTIGRRPQRKGEGQFRIAQGDSGIRRVLVLALAAMVAGCLPGPSTVREAVKKPSVPNLSAVLRTDSGAADVYSATTPRRLLWKVYWKKMSANVGKSGLSLGLMKNVSAELMEGSAKGVHISGDQGTGDQVAKRLLIEGNVVVISADGKSRMTCKSLKFDSARQLLYADGNVNLSDAVGSIGPFSQLICTSDFQKVGTPGEFARP